jgi:hypothetical protein
MRACQLGQFGTAYRSFSDVVGDAQLRHHEDEGGCLVSQA